MLLPAVAYFNAQTTFFMSLDAESRDRLTNLIEDSLQLRSAGLSTKEIEERLNDDMKLIEGCTQTPRMVRLLVLGHLEVDGGESGTMAISS
jgi:flagellar motor component MotA